MSKKKDHSMQEFASTEGKKLGIYVIFYKIPSHPDYNFKMYVELSNDFWKVEKKGRKYLGGLAGYKTYAWVRLSLFEYFIKVLPFFN